MASRTNKMWILKKKKQLQKQQKTSITNKAELEKVKKEYVNPKGNKYVRFFRAGKLICDSTTCREDPDWYRLVGKPNSGEFDFIFKWKESRCFRRRERKQKRIHIK